MEVQLTSRQQAFLEERVRNGRFATVDDAVREAVALLAERERPRAGSQTSRMKSLAQIFAESPFRGLDIEFPRANDLLRPVEL